MTRRVATVAVFLLAAACIIATSGCAGTADTEVRNDPKVIASYLGTDERAIDRSDSARA